MAPTTHVTQSPPQEKPAETPLYDHKNEKKKQLKSAMQNLTVAISGVHCTILRPFK